MTSRRVEKELIIVAAGQDCGYCAAEFAHKHEIRKEDGYINVQAIILGDKERKKFNIKRATEAEIANILAYIKNEVEKVVEPYIFQKKS